MVIDPFIQSYRESSWSFRYRAVDSDPFFSVDRHFREGGGVLIFFTGQACQGSFLFEHIFQRLIKLALGGGSGSSLGV